MSIIPVSLMRDHHSTAMAHRSPIRVAATDTQVVFCPQKSYSHDLDQNRQLVDIEPDLILYAALGLAGGVVAAFVLEYYEDLRNKRSVHSLRPHFVAPGLLRSLRPRSRVFVLKPTNHQVDEGFISFAG
jgi:hypothetical protein